jgi:hypothetical protein
MGVKLMRFLILAAAVGAAVVPAAASAQYYGGGHGYNNRGYGNNRVAQERRECRRELRRADSRREYRRELRECQREIAAAARRGYRDHDRRGYRGDRWRDRY